MVLGFSIPSFSASNIKSAGDLSLSSWRFIYMGVYFGFLGYCILDLEIFASVRGV